MQRRLSGALLMQQTMQLLHACTNLPMCGPAPYSTERMQRKGSGDQTLPSQPRPSSLQLFQTSAQQLLQRRVLFGLSRLKHFHQVVNMIWAMNELCHSINFCPLTALFAYDDCELMREPICTLVLLDLQPCDDDAPMML